jgi:hypothetical protein
LPGQDGRDVVAMLALRGRDVDLEFEPKAKELLGPIAIGD